VRKKINQYDRKSCFEIFGYDFIFDSDYNPWLIEINTNPSMEESNKLLKSYLPRMIDDALKLSVDMIFPKKKKTGVMEDVPLASPSAVGAQIVFPVSGYPDNQNMWEFICNLGIPPEAQK
jgi:hypothetical protein